MIPQISEFSYGFALTNELVGWLSLAAAPIFPSLLEEGKKGGGYDMKFEKPGIPMYLQFKRAEYMIYPSAKQFREIKASPHSITLPYFRFYLMQKNQSQQHQMLFELDNGKNAVFYAAPRFHRTSEINTAWTSKTVASRSIFVAPSQIGILPDAQKHCVAYDDSSAFFCSVPRPLEVLSFEGVQARLASDIKRDDRPLRMVIDDALNEAVEIRNRPRHAPQAEVTHALFDDLSYGAPSDLLALRVQKRGVQQMRPSVRGAAKGASPPTVPPQIGEVQEPRERTPDEQALERLAEIAMRDFDAQLVIVQTRE